MNFTRKPKPRAKPLDLGRRAELLGVTPGHLSQVISGKRQSASLTRRLQELEKTDLTSTPGKS
jgi:predicted transcriptional regulator